MSSTGFREAPARQSEVLAVAGSDPRTLELSDQTIAPKVVVSQIMSACGVDRTAPPCVAAGAGMVHKD